MWILSLRNNNMLGHNNKPFHGPTSKHTSKLKLSEFPWYIWRIRKKLGLITISRVWKWQDNWMVCVPWGRVSYPGFKEMSIINTQLPNFRFHNMRKVRINYSNVSVCSWKMVARAFPRKCEQDWTTFLPRQSISTSCGIWGTYTANCFHGGRGQLTTLFTHKKFKYTE